MRSQALWLHTWLLLLALCARVAQCARPRLGPTDSDLDAVVTPPREQPKSHSPDKASGRVVWILWFDGWRDAPWLVKAVARSWEVHNPGWAVVRLSQDNLGQYVSAPYLTDMARAEERTNRGWKKPLRNWLRPAQSDVIRVHLLSTLGGVWADATLLCNQGLDRWVYDAVSPTGFFGYTSGSEDHPLPADYSDVDEEHQRQVHRGVPPPPTSSSAGGGGDGDGDVGGRDSVYLGRHACSWFLVSTRHARLMTRWRNAVDAYWAGRLDGSVASKGYFWLDALFLELIAQDGQAAADWGATPRVNCDAPGGAHMFGFTSHLRLTAADRAVLESKPPHVLKLSRHKLPDSVAWLSQLWRPREWRRVPLRTTAAYKAVKISLARGEARTQLGNGGGEHSTAASQPGAAPHTLLLRDCVEMSPARARAAVLRWRREQLVEQGNRSGTAAPALVRDACSFCAAVPGLPLARCVPVPPWTTS
jgi:hypothetical protein